MGIVYEAIHIYRPHPQIQEMSDEKVQRHQRNESLAALDTTVMRSERAEERRRLDEEHSSDSLVVNEDLLGMNDGAYGQIDGHTEEAEQDLPSRQQEASLLGSEKEHRVFSRLKKVVRKAFQCLGHPRTVYNDKKGTVDDRKYKFSQGKCKRCSRLEVDVKLSRLRPGCHRIESECLGRVRASMNGPIEQRKGGPRVPVQVQQRPVSPLIARYTASNPDL